jgi:uncharacterized membrane protein YqhA
MVEEGRDRVQWPAESARDTHLAIRIFSSSRYFAAFAVLGAFLAAITLYVYGTLVVIQLIWETIMEYHVSVEGVRHLQVVFIEMTDVFLLGTVLLIVAFGLYQLFIEPGIPVPDWLRIRNLDQLTERLVDVVAVLLAVTFLAFAVEGALESSLIEFGVSAAIVIAALSLLLVVSHRRPTDHDAPPPHGG